MILCGASSAANTPLSTVHNGIVSGDLYVNATQPVPFANQPTSASTREFNQTYNIPTNTGIDWSQIYINIYSGSGSANWPVNATIKLDGNGDGVYETTLGSEILSSTTYSTDGTVYQINDHCTRVYSDYQLWYNITGLITCNNPSIYVKTEQIGTDLYDGRLKMIALVAAYNDGDTDKVHYWVNDGQDWISTGTSSTNFTTNSINKTISNATLNTVALSSKDGAYNFNGADFTGTNPVSPVNFFETHSWNVTSNITPGGNSSLTYAMVSGQSSFKNVLATLTLKEQPSIDLAVTGSIDVVPTGKNTVFAKETNPVKATIKNNGTETATNILISLFASDVSNTIPVATTTVDSLAGEESVNLEMIDPTVRNLEGGTVTYTLKLDPDNSILETDETNNLVTSTSKNVKYNGYKGKNYWENGSNITTQRTYDIQGDVVFSSGNSSYQGGGWNDYTVTWNETQPNIPGSASIKETWLYVPYNWDEANLMPNNVTLTFNGSVINYINCYSDQSNFGTYANYKYGLLTYNVTGLYNKNGVNTLLIDRNGTSSIAMYPLTMMVIYEDASSTHKQIFINEETDLLGFSQTSYGTTQDEATAYVPFTGLTINTSQVKSATLYSFAGSAGPNEGNLLWNGSIIIINAWQGSSSTASALVTNLTGYLGSNNTAGIQSTNSGGMAAYQQILVVEYAPDLVVTEIKPNKGNGDYLFANEPNIISVTIKNQGDSAAPESTLKVEINGTNHTINVPALSAGASTIVTVTDNTSRSNGDTLPVNTTSDPSNTIPETNEANNTLNTTLTVYNNGYKGKRYTNGSDLETQQHFNGKYDVVYSSGNSTYNGANWTSKTYNWTSSDLNIPSGANVVSARLYQGYAYNKKSSDPAWTLMFNGSTVSAIASYSDTKGWGSYNYPYGLFVYDVTGLFNKNANNITINPESGNDYALYGAYLIVVYEDPNIKSKNIWINDGFDMLCSKTSYSVNDSEATAYANFNGVNTNITNAQVINILASSNDANKSKFFFNGNEFTGFWSNYNSSSQTGFSIYDVTGKLVSGANYAAMQSYDTGAGGDNMYAMGSILVTTNNERPTVTASPNGGLSNYSKTVTITAADDQDPTPKIYYTTNGDNPTTSSTLYTAPITINTTTILKFIAEDNTGNLSDIQTETYSLDFEKPVITKITPNNGAVNVTTSSIKVYFNENIKTGSGFIELLNKSGNLISTNFSVSGNVLTITPKSPLKENRYTLCLHTGSVTDLAGNKLSLISSKFTTGTSPKVTKWDPKNNETKVYRTKIIQLTFNESIKYGNKFIELKNSKGTVIPIKISINDNKLKIKSKSALSAKTKYTICLHTGCVTDAAGNPVKLNSSKFTTA